MSMEGGSLVFNSGYKSIAAEWLGLSGEKSSVDRYEVESEGEDESEQVSKSKQENLKKKSNKTQHDSQKHKNVKRKEEKVKLSIEVGQKLGKKLTKAKKRSHERANVEKDNRGFKADSSDDDEKSKVDLVKKPRLESANNKTTSTPLTVKDVTKRLKDATLSKPARKRLKKKLKQLQEKDKESMNLNTNKKVNSTKPQPTKEEAKLKRKEIDEFSKNFLSGMQNSNNMKKDKSKFTNVMKKERNLDNADKSVFSVDRAGDNHLKDTKTNPPSKKKTKKKKSAFSESSSSPMSPKPLKKKTLNGKISKVSSEEGAKEESESDNTLKKKRKRRSKQKNINKDHRADSEKPSHLQGAGIKRVKKTTSGDDSDS